MGLRPYSRADRKLVFYVFCCGFFSLLFTEFLTYLLLLSCYDHDPADVVMLLPFSPLTHCFQTFLGFLHVNHSYCSLMPLPGAAGFALALQLTLQGLSFTVKGLKTTLLQKCLSWELLFSVSNNCNKRMIYKSMPAKQKHFWMLPEL